MGTRIVIGFVLLVAHALAAAVFPGGPVLCNEGGGVVKVEPLHAPHAPSCCPEGGGDFVPALESEAHTHDGCTDTPAISPCAPPNAKEMKAPAVAAAPTTLPVNLAAPPADPDPEPRALPPPTSPLISTTVIRS